MARFTVFCLIMANALLISAAVAESHEEKQVISEAPTASRKLGNHHFPTNIATPPIPAPSPAAEVSGEGESGGGAEEEVMESNLHHHHRSFEKSVAGGGAIIGVLAAVFLTAVFCYIRATRRRPVQPGSPTDSASSERKMVESARAGMK